MNRSMTSVQDVFKNCVPFISFEIDTNTLDIAKAHLCPSSLQQEQLQSL